MIDTQDPDVAAAIREQLILRVENSRASDRIQSAAQFRQRRDRRSRFVATGITVVVVLAASVAGISLAARSGGAGPAGAVARPPASVEFDGKRIPAAGAVSWSDAVTGLADPRMVTISASGMVLRRTTWFCTLAQWRFATVETATSVRIEVQGYAVPLDPDTYCNASNPQPHELRVQLAAPLGTRTLIDASTMHTRPALDAGSVPTSGLMPSIDTETIAWDQQSGIATRTWVDPAQPSDGSVSLEFGTPAALAASDAISRTPDVSGIAIDGAAASLWNFESSGGGGERTTRIEWTTTDGHRIRLDFVQTPSGRQYGQAEVSMLARSVR